MQYSAYKCLIRKGEQGPTLGPQSHHANCDICGKLFLSLAGLSKAIFVNVQILSKGGHETKEVVSLKTERTAIIYT